MKKNPLRALLSHSFVKHSAVSLAGNMSVNVMAYLFHLVVGRILGPGKYGELTALLSLFYIINAPTLVLQTIVVKFFTVLKAKQALGEAKSLFFFFTTRMLVLLGLGFLVIIAIQGILASFLHLSSPWYISALYGIFAFYLLGVINISILQAYQQFFVMSVFTNISSFFRLTLGIIFAYWGVGWTLLSNVLSNLLGYVALLFPLLFLIKAKAQPYTVSKREAVSYSIPTLIAIVTITALYSQDVLWVKHYFTSVEAGLYASLSVLGKVIFFASSILGSVAFPIVAERKALGVSANKIVAATIGVVSGMSFGLSICYFLFPAFIVKLLFGAAFSNAQEYLGIFGLFISFFSLANLMVTMLLALGRTKVWMFTTIAAVSQALGLMYYHQTFHMVISVNIIVTISLCIALLVYYRYGRD